MTAATGGKSPMTVHELLAELHRLDIRVLVEGNRLRLNAPKGALTDVLRDAVRVHRDDLLSLMSQTASSNGGDAPLPPITPRPSSAGPVPLSYAQRQLWMLERLQPGNTTYNVPLIFRLRDRVDPAGLEAALREVGRRHDILRTRIVEQGDEPVQIVGPVDPLTLTVTDLTALPPVEREIEAKRLIDEEAHRPFDLRAGPLLRARLLVLAPDENIIQITVHHIAADGWSLHLLVRELITLYRAVQAGRPSPFQELPIQYGDFAWWQREWLQGDRIQAHLDYWKRQLAGELPVLELPTDHPRPPIRTSRGGRQTLRLDAELHQAVVRFDREERVTPFMTLFAAFAELLHRYSGQEDLLIGAPFAGRSRTELEPLIGFFVNTVVLRADLSGRPDFRTLVRRVREMVLDAHTYQDVPFEKLLEELRPETDLSRTPLFQAFFNFLEFPVDAGEIDGAVVVSESEPDAKFDLTLYVEERPTGFDLTVVYNADLFDPERIGEMLEQYRLLVSQLVRSPDRPIGEHTLITEPARRRLPDPTQRLEAKWEGSIVQHFALQARRVPTHPAVEDAGSGTTWSYRALEQASNRLAHWLGEHGVGPREVVAIYAHRSAALVWAMLGTLKAGAAFVILDPAHPSVRLVECLRQARPRALLQLEAAGAVPPELEAFLSEAAASIPRLTLPSALDRAEALVDRFPETAPAVEITPDALAYLAFTSGTTGRPKGVSGPHRPLSHFFQWYRTRLHLADSDRFSLLSGLAHDPLLRDVFAPLWVGGTLCIPEPGAFEASGRLAEWLRAARVSVVHLTPPMVELLTQGGEVELPAVRLACFGADQLTRRHVRRFRRLAKAAQCVNFYGATETPQAMGYWPVVDREEGSAEARAPSVPEVLPLGTGIDGVQLLVVNGSGGLAGIGELGEIAVRTPYLAAGYRDDEALTRERFVPNPFGTDPRDRVYLTGDLGRYRPDGNVVFWGRRDRQVKLRGFRIELGEVEAALVTLPGVREAVAVLREDRPGQLQLVAYLVGDGLGTPISPTVRRHLSPRLPAHMIPSAAVVLAALPRTPNGKLSVRDLPAPEAGTEAARTPPRTAVERELCRLWQDALRTDAVGIHDNFFELGGHSLAAVRLFHLIETRFGKRLSLATFFYAPTVAQLAELLEERSPAPARSAPAIPIRPRADGEMPPLSVSQQQLWLLDQLDPGKASYNIVGAVRLRGALDVEALRRSLLAIVHRHETLRTTFTAEDGAPRIVIDPTGTVLLDRIDLSSLPHAERETRARDAIADLAMQPFDLTRLPLFRVALYRLGEDDHILASVTHHIIADAWSQGVFMRELSALYEADGRNGPPPLADLPFRYGDYARWHRDWLDSGIAEEELRYWRERLSGPLPVLELPTDRPRPATLDDAGLRLSLAIPDATAEALRGLARDEGTTLFMVLLTGFQIFLARYTGQDDVIVGTAVANRPVPELDGLIGCFLNTLAIRSDLSGNPSARRCLHRVRDAALGAMAHQNVPFQRVVDAVKPERSLNRSPLFQTMLVLHHLPDQALRLGKLAVEPFTVETTPSRLDLTVDVRDTGTGLVCGFRGNLDLFDRASIDRMQRHYLAVLAAMAGAPDTAIAALPLLSAAERTAVLIDGNATAAPGGERADLVIERHAAATPDRPAVRFGDVVLSYRDLVAAADALATRLRQAGIGPESRVGVYLERSERMIVALLGVWKAGAAYVPLDPSYPTQRIRFIATDAQLHAVVTESGLADRLPSEMAGAVVRLDDTVTSEMTSTLPPVDRPDTALAYILYTSGSTGQPKGVMIEHRSLANLLESFRHEPGLTADDVLLAITTLSFDIAGLELFLPLVAGGQVVVLDRETAQDGRALADAIRRYAPTVLQATPATWRMLIDAGWTGAPALGIWCGGEALPRALADELLRRGREVWNLYGPTETTIWSTRQRVHPGTGPVPIGRPIANTTAYVLDAHRQPVPAMVAGELYLGGLGVARGYHDRPALTAERFVPDPFSSDPDARLYRTGDQARYRPDGVIEYLGRVDNQVKIRGFRIELGEIEAVLAQHPDVDEAVVTVCEEQAGQPRLVAYLRTASGRVDPTLRDWLRDRLPPYMLPAHFVALAAFPLTPNGKVDRKALPTPDTGAPAADGWVAPEPGLETLIAGVWQDTLGVAQVGATDNFFDLGGDSLQAVRLLANVEKLVGHRIPVTVFFQGQTVRAMARAIVEATDDPDALAVVIQHGNRERPIFIVPGIGGEIVGYETLAGTLQTTDAIYGLRSVGLDGDAPPLERVEEIATRFVAEVRRVHPAGPYRLLGLCVGGMVAYEMAQQLQAEGASVELVGLIDTWPASLVAGVKRRFAIVTRIADLTARTIRVLTNVWKAPAGTRLAYLRSKNAAARAMVVQRDVFRGDARERGRALVMEANQRAASRYRPKPYPGTGFLVITTGRNLPAYRDPRLIWQRLLRDAAPVLRVPGPDSGALLRPPFVSGLADALHQRLDSNGNGTSHP